MENSEDYNYTPLPTPTRIIDHAWPEDIIPVVHTRHMVYNHKEYIKDCIEGVLMQKTTFPVQILIHDDCSTDGTTEIVKEYATKHPELIKLYVQEENSYSSPNKEEKRKEFYKWCIGKYEAICEGDDYWTDPLKLQKQVMFLEQNKNYVLSYSYALSLNVINNKFNKRLNGKKYETLREIINSNKIPTLTTVFRKDIHDMYLKEINPSKQGWKMGDYPFWIYCSMKGKIHFLPTVTGVYRILESSLSHSKECSKTISFIESVYGIKVFFIHKYSLTNYSLKKLTLIKDFETVKALLRTRNLSCAVGIFKDSKFKIHIILKLITELARRIFMNKKRHFTYL